VIYNRENIAPCRIFVDGCEFVQVVEIDGDTGSLKYWGSQIVGDDYLYETYQAASSIFVQFFDTETPDTRHGYRMLWPKVSHSAEDLRIPLSYWSPKE
jgi:hypothetical protein